MDNNKNPLYTIFVAGYPINDLQFYKEAAQMLGVNLNVKYHGCIINYVDIDEQGNVITDADIEALKIKSQNIEAELFYKKLLGKNWLNKVKKNAKQMCQENNLKLEKLKKC